MWTLVIVYVLLGGAVLTVEVEMPDGPTCEAVGQAALAHTPGSATAGGYACVETPVDDDPAASDVPIS